jgi:hypothetical protein
VPPFSFCSVRRASILVSGFIVWHLVAITLAAVPSREDIGKVHGERFSPDDGLARIVRPPLDAVQPAFENAVVGLRDVLEPVRRLTGPYITKLSMGQRWRMFAQPPHTNMWMVIRVASRMPDGARDTENILAMPGSGLYAWRFASAYGPGFRDKALANALDAYIQLRQTPDAPADGWTRFGRDVLAPISRYYADERRRQLPAGAQVERLEIWQGYQIMAGRGDPPVPRIEVDRYYEQLPLHARAATGVHLDDTFWTLLRADDFPILR